MLKTHTLEQRLLYEVNGETLIIYNLSINRDYRFHRMVPNIRTDYPDAFYAKTIQGRWTSKPLSDLLDKDNKEAKTTMSIIKIRSMRKKVIRGCLSSFQLLHRWKGKEYNLSGVAKNEIEKFQRIEQKGFEDFFNGRNTYQPIRIVNNSQCDKGCTFLLPTAEYGSIERQKSSKQVDIMPAIIELPPSIYLSHLVDIGDYERFLQEEYVNEYDRINSFSSFTLVSRNDIPLACFSQKEQNDIKTKAKRDKTIVDMFKRNKNIN